MGRKHPPKKQQETQPQQNYPKIGKMKPIYTTDSQDKNIKPK